MREVGLGEAVQAGGQRTLFVLQQGVLTIKGLFNRQVGVKDLGGPVLIASWSAESAKRGPMDLLLFIAFISINIGMLNILPIPVLDGGHFVMITLEAIARRPIPAKIKLGIQQVGMIALLGLMAVVLWNDIGRVGWLSKITNLF
jgi:regulator of sigma E protease